MSPAAEMVNAAVQPSAPNPMSGTTTSGFRSPLPPMMVSRAWSMMSLAFTAVSSMFQICRPTVIRSWRYRRDNVANHLDDGAAKMICGCGAASGREGADVLRTLAAERQRCQAHANHSLHTDIASLVQMLTILSTFSAQRLLHDIQCVHMEGGEHEEYDGDFLFPIACVDSEL